MKNELLINKISKSIASKTVSDNLIYLSMAMIEHEDRSIRQDQHRVYNKI